LSSGLWVGQNGQNATSALADAVSGKIGVVNVVDSSRVDVTLTNAGAVNLGNNDNAGAYGAGLNVTENGTGTNLWSGQNGQTGAANVIHATGGTVTEVDNSHIDVYGTPAVVLEGATDYLGLYVNGVTATDNGNGSYLYDYGLNNTENIYGDNVVVADNSAGTIVLDYGKNDEVNLLSTKQKAYAYGYYGNYYDHANDPNAIWLGDPGHFNGVSGTYTLDFRHIVMGFAGSQANAAATLHAASAATGDMKAGLQEVQYAIDTGASRMVTGTLFDHPVITWSIDSPDPGFSGQLGANELPSVQDAFQNWAAASGLKFVQVKGNAPADIEIGWAKLNTASTGVIGLTAVNSDARGNTTGVVITLEDKGETAIGSDGTYTGTDATLTQVLEHEVGHALGLGDNADPTSIESYFLNSSDRSIGASDSELVRQLYWAVEGHSTPYYSDSVRAAMAYMASFGPDTGNSAVHLTGVQDGHAATITMHGGM
jgi:hypothetical protein